MGIEFQVSKHPMTRRSMVEVLEEGKLIAGIHDHDGGIKIVSKYLDGVDHEHVAGFPPSVIIKLSDRK